MHLTARTDTIPPPDRMVDVEAWLIDEMEIPQGGINPTGRF
jgi:hypothetical protein